MKGIAIKLLKLAVVAGLGLVVLRLIGPKVSKRMDRMFDEASEDFPPKWMYVNITAIRENTERLLDALPHESVDMDPAVV